MKLPNIKGFLNRNYFVKQEEIIYTWWRDSVKQYLLKTGFDQVKNREIVLGKDNVLVCYRIDVGRKTFNVCELQIDSSGILIVNDGFFEKGDIKEWKNKL